MKYFVYAVTGAVAVAVVAGFFVVGSPTRERDRQFDERRISDLSLIQSQVVTYWQRNGELPATPDDLRDEIGGFLVPTDPETGVAYEYTGGTERTFELCATFTLPSVREKDNPTAMSVPRPVGGVTYEEGVWWHGVGRSCFERTIDPALYPPAKSSRAAGGCLVTGCSGQVCADREVVTTCEWTPAYACYGKHSTCERQPSGQCGWTPTAALTQCLAESRTAPADTPQ